MLGVPARHVEKRCPSPTPPATQKETPAPMGNPEASPLQSCAFDLCNVMHAILYRDLGSQTVLVFETAHVSSLVICSVVSVET